MEAVLGSEQCRPQHCSDQYVRLAYGGQACLFYDVSRANDEKATIRAMMFHGLNITKAKNSLFNHWLFVYFYSALILLFHECNCSLAASNLPVTSADKISAAQIQQYFEEASGKKDWSKRAWAKWCTMEKGLHQESMDILCEVSTKGWSLFFYSFYCGVLQCSERSVDLVTCSGFQILKRFQLPARVLASYGFCLCQ